MVPEQNSRSLKTDARPILLGLYPVAIAIMVVPLMEILAGSWPFNIGNVAWRFGVGGLLLKSFLVPFTGLGYAALLATVLEQRRVLRVISVLGLVGALVVAGMATLFVLDYLQIRPSLAAELRPSMDRVSLTTVMVSVIIFPMALALGIGGWKSSRTGGPGQRGPAKTKDIGLIVAPPPTPKESVS